MEITYRTLECTRCGAPREVIDGRCLRAQRELRNRRQSYVARKAGVSAMFVSEVERNLKVVPKDGVLLAVYENLVDARHEFLSLIDRKKA